MALFQKLFKQTFIYGVATVVPRMLSFLLTPLYTKLLPKAEYGEVSIVFAWIVFFNVILAYGMETSFFRFFHKEEHREKVTATSSISILGSTVVFLLLAFLFRDAIAAATNIGSYYLNYVIFILALDALVVIPFGWLRAQEKPRVYSVIKIGNVAVNLGLNVFFLVFLPRLAESGDLFDPIYKPDFEIAYIFISNLIASAITLLVMLPFYFKLSYTFDSKLWKQMMSYSAPILIAGIAFAINEVVDKILLDLILPESIAKAEVGAYAACYKLALL